MPTEDYHGFEWLRRSWDELRRSNFQWVAVDGSGPIASNPDLAEVIQSVIQQQAQDRAVYTFVDFEEEQDEDDLSYGRL
jgi:hypothetical protein